MSDETQTSTPAAPDTQPSSLASLGKPGARRGQGLHDLGFSPPAARPRKREPVAAPAETEVEKPVESRNAGDDVAETSQPIANRPAVQKKPRIRAPRVRADDQPPTATVYVTEDVQQRFEHYRRMNRRSNRDVILEAISKYHKELDQVLDDARINTGVANELFPPDPRQVRYQGGGGVQVQFMPTPEQEVVIDRLTEGLGFNNRSTWIAPVLDKFLPPLPRRKK